MSQPVTPCEGRVVYVEVGGHRFGLRRPSRADVAEIWRRLTAKLGRPTLEQSDLLNSWDGRGLQWEARLEVLLLPRVGRMGEANLGECAPSHWIEELKDPSGNVIGRTISFANVMPEEFEHVCDAFASVFDEKKSPPQPNSGDSASEPTSG